MTTSQESFRSASCNDAESSTREKMISWPSTASDSMTSWASSLESSMIRTRNRSGVVMGLRRNPVEQQPVEAEMLHRREKLGKVHRLLDVAVRSQLVGLDQVSILF